MNNIPEGSATTLLPSIGIVIPCFNEEQTIEQVVRGFRTALPDAGIYVIDNNSTDATAEKARGVGAMVIMESRQGKGNALRNIVRRISADIYVLVDGDMTYPSDAVKELLAPVLRGDADMVVGDRLSNLSYERHNQRRFHGIGNQLVKGLVNSLFHARLHDIMSGYRVMTRDFLEHLPLLSEGFEVETELTLHALDKRFRIVEVPIEYRDRPVGSVSKLRTFSDGMRVLNTIAFILKNYKPLFFFSILSGTTFAAGVMIGIPPVLEFLEYQYVFKVPSAVLAASLMILSMLFFCCGLILDTVVRHQRENYELLLNRCMVGRSRQDGRNISQM